MMQAVSQKLQISIHPFPSSLYLWNPKIQGGIFMSTNKTENLNLHQWAPSDPVALSEVNANFTALDAAVAKAQEAADEAAVLPYVVGSYPGNGGSQTINLGFKPRFVIISGMKSNSNSGGYTTFILFFLATGGNVLTDQVTFTDTGFTVLGGSVYPDPNNTARTYDYIAFR
jgi:hypothetical protein